MAAAPYEQRDPYVLTLCGEHNGDEAWARSFTEGQTLEPNEGIDWLIKQLGHSPDEFR